MNASKNISKLSNKIELLLSLFRGKQKEIKMMPTSYHLAKACNDLTSELQVIYSDKQAKCNIAIPENMMLHVDPFYFEMAIRNLLDNAFKYSDPPAVIEIQTKKGAKELYISIRDDGKGIAPKKQKKIFQEFYRADHNRKGHGIGLSFSQQIIKAHRGRIELKSEPGKGSTFCIVLPIEACKRK